MNEFIIYKILKVVLPMALLGLLFFVFYRGLHQDPRLLPSALVNKSVPEFHLRDALTDHSSFSKADLLNHVSLVNVFATWCEACRYEQAMMMDIANSHQVVMYAIDYKDQMDSLHLWLKEWGNPYQKIGFDNQGKVSINWGVYGTPETYLIDKKGFIRYKHVGLIDKTIWRDEFLPLIQTLKKQGA